MACSLSLTCQVSLGKSLSQARFQFLHHEMVVTVSILLTSLQHLRIN